MDAHLLSEIKLTNPWLEDPTRAILDLSEYIQRKQTKVLLSHEWDKQWLILIGPRRAGKTTLGKYLCSQLNESKRFDNTLYLNCDYLSIRQALDSPLGIIALQKHFKLLRPIIFIDEVQRLENPGLLLKAIADLQLPIKLIATGSSQLEIKSKIQEHLTGRQFAVHIYPLSSQELGSAFDWEESSIFGNYPQVLASNEKRMELAQLYEAYVRKDIVEILKIGKPDILQNLLTLIAHSSGQLVNFSQLSIDCKVSSKTIQNYLSILEQTFVLSAIQPFVGNKRTEITSNPIYYFIDNGFRNHALGNFTPLSSRNDNGLLVESLVFQELLKYKVQSFMHFSIHYWRTKSGAEVDFVLFKNQDTFIPLEVKFQNLPHPAITRGYRSFLQAYKPKNGIVINKNILESVYFDDCLVHFIPLSHLNRLWDHLALLN